MPWYRNRGARFRTLDGVPVESGGIFEAEVGAPDVLRRRHKLSRASAADASHARRTRATTTLPLDTWGMTVDEARPLISTMDGTPDLFQALHDRESARPNGKRKGILDALEERIGESTVDDPAEGTARGPSED